MPYENDEDSVGISPPPAPKKRRRSYILFSFEEKNEISEPINENWFSYISGYVVPRKYRHLRSILDRDSQKQFEAVKQFTSAVRTLKTEHDDIREKNNMISKIVGILEPLVRSNLDLEDRIGNSSRTLYGNQCWRTCS